MSHPDPLVAVLDANVLYPQWLTLRTAGSTPCDSHTRAGAAGAGVAVEVTMSINQPGGASLGGGLEAASLHRGGGVVRSTR